MTLRSLSGFDHSAELWFISLVLEISMPNLPHIQKIQKRTFLPKTGFPPWFWLWYHLSPNNKTMDSSVLVRLWLPVCLISRSKSAPHATSCLHWVSCSVGFRLTRERAAGEQGLGANSSESVLPSEVLTKSCWLATTHQDVSGVNTPC